MQLYYTPTQAGIKMASTRPNQTRPRVTEGDLYLFSPKGPTRGLIGGKTVRQKPTWHMPRDTWHVSATRHSRVISPTEKPLMIFNFLLSQEKQRNERTHTSTHGRTSTQRPWQPPHVQVRLEHAWIGRRFKFFSQKTQRLYWRKKCQMELERSLSVVPWPKNHW